MSKLNVTDARMLEAYEHIINTGRERWKLDISRNTGIINQNVRNIKLGKQHFTAEDIRQLCKVYNVNVEFIFGFSSRIFNKKKPINRVNKKPAEIQKSA
ncbi:hypothetical protein [Christiangramia sp.]|uniref:hypothetical protein n=1 Tax=Christiangramia sp. TaxID=1931228 RepID=UPI0026164106|nr:hypothetical protein [Christiangramia sp.]